MQEIEKISILETLEFLTKIGGMPAHRSAAGRWRGDHRRSNDRQYLEIVQFLEEKFLLFDDLIVFVTERALVFMLQSLLRFDKLPLVLGQFFGLFAKMLKEAISILSLGPKESILPN